MIILNFLMSYIIFPFFFSSIIYIFTTIEKHSYTKGLILILGLFIFINYYFYKKIVMIIRKTYVNRINYYLSIILIFLTFFNIENFKEVITIMNQNIKKNFNQEIFLEIKNISNTVSFFNLFSIIFIMEIIFLSTIIYNKKNNKVEENNEEIKLLSFREKEKDKLKSLIENKKISSILIEAEMGNGKTTLIDSIFKEWKNKEIIYLKLPLIKSVDELKSNLFLELQKIFLKNDLDSQFLNVFLNNISAFKFGFLEINFGKKENMWNTIQKLQKTLKKLGKNIIIVLDDIERENDANKIYESILFLGELSEYFKDTRTTTLLLAQYSFLEDKLEKMNKETLYLEKYYKYKFKLNEPTISEFLDDDYKILIEEAISTSFDLTLKSNEKEDLINSIIKNINFFFNKISNKNTKLNIRSLEKSIQKIIYLYDFYKDSYITYSIFTYCILEENFQKVIDLYISQIPRENTISKEEIKNSILKNYCNNSLKDYSKSNTYTVFFKEIIDIISIYKKGEVLIEKLDIQSNTIKEILKRNIEKTETFSIKGYEEYIFNLIKGSSTKINIALENNLIAKKSELRKAINSISEIFQPSKVSIDKMKEILLRREYIQREIEEKDDKKDTIPELLEISLNSSIKIQEIYEERSRELDEDFNIFIKKISEIEDLKSDLPEISKLLEKDKLQLKKEGWLSD